MSLVLCLFLFPAPKQESPRVPVETLPAPRIIADVPTLGMAGHVPVKTLGGYRWYNAAGGGCDREIDSHPAWSSFRR